MLIFRGIPEHNRSPVAMTIGNFDGVHLGHQAMLTRLEQAARTLGIPACVMTFEPHPREFFAPHAAPARLTNLREKLERFEQYGIDQVVICRFNHYLAHIDATEFITRYLCRQLRVQWLLTGDDFRFGARRAGDFALLNAAGKVHGFEVVSMDSVVTADLRVSSTAIRNALATGDLALAARLLGRPYSISGRVIHGDKNGRKLGFPTANVQLKHNKPPLSGIFAIKLYGLSNTGIIGVASLGVRPTIRPNDKPTLEAHLFNFDHQIYGRHVRVDFLHKLRDEQKFPSLDVLIQAISQDVSDAKAYFATAT